MASSSLSSGLVQASISPADGRLVFSLPAAGAAASASASASASACACALTITNTSTTTTGGPCLAFKIKTTKPRRYLVRPCQGVLRPGEKQEVSILVPPERLGEVLRALEAGEGDDASSSDKFQVLFAGVDEATYWVVAGRGGEGNDGQQQQRLDRVWAQLDKRVIRERRLDVEFSSRASKHQQRLPSASSALSGFASSGPMTMAESRKRYDDLVTVTVALTAERDTLLNALDTLKFELRRELASQGERGQHVAAGGTVKQDQLSLHKRRRSKASSAAFMSSIPGIAAHARDPSSGLSMGPTGAGGRYHGDGRQHHAPEQRRFSTKAVAVAAVLAFLIARWL